MCYDVQVVGDVVMLSTGDILPADGVILGRNDLAINEKMLTGVCLFVYCIDVYMRVYMYTCASVYGFARAIVVYVMHAYVVVMCVCACTQSHSINKALPFFARSEVVRRFRSKVVADFVYACVHETYSVIPSRTDDLSLKKRRVYSLFADVWENMRLRMIVHACIHSNREPKHMHHQHGFINVLTVERCVYTDTRSTLCVLAQLNHRRDLVKYKESAIGFGEWVGGSNRRDKTVPSCLAPL